MNALTEKTAEISTAAVATTALAKRQARKVIRQQQHRIARPFIRRTRLIDAAVGLSALAGLSAFISNWARQHADSLQKGSFGLAAGAAEEHAYPGESAMTSEQTLAGSPT